MYTSINIKICFKFIYIYKSPASRFLPTKAVLFGENLECHPMPDRIYCHIYIFIYIYIYIHNFGVILVFLGVHNSKIPYISLFLGIQASVQVHISINIYIYLKFIYIYISKYLLLHDSSPQKQSFSGKTQNATPCRTVYIVIYTYIDIYLHNFGVILVYFGVDGPQFQNSVCVSFFGASRHQYMYIYIYVLSFYIYIHIYLYICISMNLYIYISIYLYI